MPDDLLDLSLRIIRGPARDRLTSTDLKLLKMAADGKIKTPETRRMFLETFRDIIEPGFLPAVSSISPGPAVPAVQEDGSQDEQPASIVEDERPPAKIPRPNSQMPYVIRGFDVVRETDGSARDADVMEHTVFALSLIYPENMDLIARAVEYVLEHQLGTAYSDSEQLHRLQDGLREVRRAVDGLRERARERTPGPSEMIAG